MRPSLNRRGLILSASASALAAGGAWAASDDPFVAIEARLGGQLGVYAADLQTGAVLARHADQRFPMCSTFKLSLAGAVLEAADKGALSLDRKIHYGPADLLEYAPTARAHVREGEMTLRDLCEAAVELSDNTAANLLLKEIGGPAGLTAYWRGWGDRQTRLDRNEPSLNSAIPGDPRDTTTPRAMVGAMKALLLGEALKPESRDLLLQWMRECQTGLTKLRSGFPAGVMIGDKTGNSGTDTMGDLAIVQPQGRKPILIACYLTLAKVNADGQTAAIAAVGRAVSQAFLGLAAAPVHG